jgi:hypothetical protein
VVVAQVLTSDLVSVPARLVHLLRCRWRLENVFKNLTAHNGIDALCDPGMGFLADERPLGERLPFDPGALTSDAEWVKHRLSRIQASLPNGFCGRPPQQDCPHPNACLTCPDFQTTVEFLPTHRRQAEETRRLVAAAEADGRSRLAENHRVVLGHLERIIDTLEPLATQADGHA